MEELRELGPNGCVVLGEPDYYGRFGFVARDDFFLENVPRQFFLAQSFAGEFPCGTVNYYCAWDRCT